MEFYSEKLSEFLKEGYERKRPRLEILGEYIFPELDPLKFAAIFLDTDRLLKEGYGGNSISVETRRYPHYKKISRSFSGIGLNSLESYIAVQIGSIATASKLAIDLGGKIGILPHLDLSLTGKFNSNYRMYELEIGLSDDCSSEEVRELSSRSHEIEEKIGVNYRLDLLEFIEHSKTYIELPLLTKDKEIITPSMVSHFFKDLTEKFSLKTELNFSLDGLGIHCLKCDRISINIECQCTFKNLVDSKTEDCGNYKLSSHESLVYFIKEGERERYKIGKTNGSQSLKERLVSLQTGNSDSLTLVKVLVSTDPYLEVLVHSHFKEERVTGEFFDISNKKLKEFNEKNFEARDITLSSLRWIDSKFRSKEDNIND